MSKKDLGEKFNCDPCVIDRVLREYNIPIRNNSESKVGLLVGEKHWNWKGGITPLARRLREFFGVNQVIKILERDHYKCQMCGSKKNLQVHHIKHFKDILKRILDEHPDLDPITNINELYNIAVKDKEFLNLDNLITYCKDCHLGKIHGYNLQADFKSCELLENLELES
ncbi:MAG: HNH endonuclease [Candidatus Coprovivens sp.]